MNKADLQQRVYDQVTQGEEASSISKTDTIKVIDTTIDTIIASLKEGNSIAIRGFGTFEVTTAAARKARNPRSGETIHVPAKKKAKFRPSGNLQASMNK